jgi:hypothetical protein
MRMEICELRVVAIRVEGLPRLPLNKNQHPSRRDITDDRFLEVPECDDATTVCGYLCWRASCVFQVLSAISDVE